MLTIWMRSHRICCGIYTHRSIHVYERLQWCVGQDLQAFLSQEMPQLPACHTGNLRQVITGHGVENHHKSSRTFPKLLALLSRYPSKSHDLTNEREGTPGRFSDSFLKVDILAFPESFWGFVRSEGPHNAVEATILTSAFVVVWRWMLWLARLFSTSVWDSIHSDGRKFGEEGYCTARKVVSNFSLRVSSSLIKVDTFDRLWYTIVYDLRFGLQ